MISLLRSFPIKKITIVGHSMHPTLREGQQVLIHTFRNSNLKEGDIIVFEKDGMYLIKRVIKKGDAFFAKGESKKHDSDSREYGPLKDQKIVGKVFFILR